MLDSTTAKSIRWAAAAVAAIGLTMLPLSPVQAAVAPTNTMTANTAITASIKPSVTKIKVTAAAIKKMRATWKTYGVSKKTQDKLIKKLKAGKAWDALKKKKAKKTKTYKKSGYTTKIYTFADGSIRVARMQLPKPKAAPTDPNSLSIRPTYVAGCTVSQSHYHYSATGCIASDNVVLFGARMTVDYWSVMGDKVATISRAYDEYAWSILTSATWNDAKKVSDAEYHMVFAVNGFQDIGTYPQILVVKATSVITLEARASA